MIDWYVNGMYGMHGMNGMRGMRNITDFPCLSFKRLTPRAIDMNNGMNGMNGMRGMRGMTCLN